MSVWTEISGTITVPKREHWSPIQSALSCFPEMTKNIIDSHHSDNYDSWIYRVNGSFCEEGDGAVRCIKQWLSDAPTSCRIDLTTTIRWIR